MRRIIETLTPAEVKAWVDRVIRQAQFNLEDEERCRQQRIAQREH